MPLLAAVTRETDDAGPEQRATLNEDIDRLAEALKELTDDQREVIELRFFAGLSVLEAAMVMGRQEGTIRGLQFRAIQSLRRTLGILAIDVPKPAPQGAPAGAIARAQARP